MEYKEGVMRRMEAIARGIALALCAALVGCQGDGPASASGATEAGRGAAARPAGKAELVIAPQGNDDVRAVVRAERDRARGDGRDLVVYVGAPWCDPCTRFHQAVQAGELDATFPTLRLLEFDQDRDGERLDAAGYGTTMIPLFVAPAADGGGSARRFAGSVKGERAVAVIVPRLSALLADARASAR